MKFEPKCEITESDALILLVAVMDMIYGIEPLTPYTEKQLILMESYVGDPPEPQMDEDTPADDFLRGDPEWERSLEIDLREKARRPTRAARRMKMVDALREEVMRLSLSDLEPQLRLQRITAHTVRAEALFKSIETDKLDMEIDPIL